MITNFYPIRFRAEEFSLRIQPFSEDLLRALRKSHNATHSFFRGGEHIYVVHMDGPDIELGESVLVRRVEAPDVVDGVVRHLLFRTFIRKLPGLKPLDFYPLRFVSRKNEHDAVRQMLPPELQGVVTYTRLNELQTRTISPSGTPEPGVLINIERHWNLARTLHDLVAERFEVIGVPAVRIEPIPGLENVLAPGESAIGRVIQVEGDHAIIDTHEGQQKVPLAELYLRKSASDIQSYLAFRLGSGRAQKIFDEIYHTEALGGNAQAYHNEIGEIADYLSGWEFVCPAGCKFTIDRQPRKVDVGLRLQPTMFRFDIAPGAAGNRPWGGLAKFGPYDKKRFSPKKPKVLVLCRPESHAGFSTSMAALENGIPESKYFQKGLRDFYHLSGIEWQIVDANTGDIAQLTKAVEAAVACNAREPFALAFVEGDEATKLDEIASNPYYHAKALLMSAGIPVQALQGHNTRLKGDSLANILGNLALQVYAKLGGTPWAVQTGTDVDHEIVVGIGHYLERSSEFTGAVARRVVGLTTFFSSDGSFLMSHVCRAVSYDEYFAELLASLEACLKELSRDYGWKKGSTVRIVFHIFKPVKQTEATVVDALIKKFPEVDIRYAFVNIINEHPYILFEDDPEQATGKGHFVPDRMQNFVVDDLACLVQLRGRGEIKAARHGFSRAALVRIHPQSTFRDLHYITQQVADFSHLSWRSFFPSSLPVTIRYSNLIAEMLDKLKRVPGWNAMAINTSLRRRKWFL